jgi:phosphatase NudJ
MSALPTSTYALVAVRLGRRFLVVEERHHGGGFYLPAGRVEPGETLAQAAERETLEEAGVRIVLEGVIGVEHTPSPEGEARLRVIFVARPADDAPPKSAPDAHTLGARWVTTEELATLPLRGEEVLDIFRYLERGGPVHPLSLLVVRNTPL